MNNESTNFIANAIPTSHPYMRSGILWDILGDRMWDFLVGRLNV
ncbi:MAG: hypothetical protein ACFCAD_05770 [Pleurocapsa sp.]